MALEAIARLRLSVWRPAQLGRQLEYATSEKDETGGGVVFDSARLQEEIYHWDPGQEDVWGCIASPALARELRDLLVETFAPNRSPEDRSMAQFQQAVDRLGKAMTKDDASTWADMQQMVKIGRKDSANLRGNTALALWNHLEWIVRTFGSVPGASVTIR